MKIRLLQLSTALLSLSLLLASAQAQGLDGVWAAGEYGDELETLFEFEGNTGTATRRGRDATLTVVSGSTHPNYAFTIEGEDDVMHLLLTSDHEAIVYFDGDDDLGYAIRLSDIPAGLLGTWDVLRPHGSRSMTGTMVVGPEQLVVTLDEGSGQRQETMAIIGGGTLGNSRYLVAWEDGQEGFALEFFPLGDGGYLCLPRFEDDAMFVYPEGTGPSAQAPQISPPSFGDNICLAAIEHVFGCVREVCQTNPSHVACRILEEELPAEALECGLPMVAEAQEVLEMSCDTLFGPSGLFFQAEADVVRESPVAEVLEDANVAQTETMILSLRAMVEMFTVLNGRLPLNLDELTLDLGYGPIADEVYADVWDRPFNYASQDGTFQISSSGPDGVQGTSDDVSPE